MMKYCRFSSPQPEEEQPVEHVCTSWFIYSSNICLKKLAALEPAAGPQQAGLNRAGPSQAADRVHMKDL